MCILYTWGFFLAVVYCTLGTSSKIVNILVCTVRRLDDDMRAAMAIDWIAREREKPGRCSSIAM
jgi:hypothetical protein